MESILREQFWAFTDSRHDTYKDKKMTESDEKMSLEFLLYTHHVIIVITSNIETGHLFHWNWKPRQSAVHCRFGKFCLI